MANESVDVLRRGFEALAAGGVEALLPFIDPDFVATVPPGLSVEPDTYRGPEGVRRYFDSFYEAVDEVRFEPEQFIARGDRVVVPTRVLVRGRGSGAEVTQRVTQVWTLRDGRAIRLDVYPTLADALEAAGRD
jgi:ketosteroid isomerase-like protein